MIYDCIICPLRSHTVAPFCPPRGAHVYYSPPTVAALPYIKVAPRVILSPAHPRAWARRHCGSMAMRYRAAIVPRSRRPPAAPVCPQRGLPNVKWSLRGLFYPRPPSWRQGKRAGVVFASFAHPSTPCLDASFPSAPKGRPILLVTI